VIAISVTVLLLEIPSGILADRWSRKGVLLLGCSASAVGTLLLGMSDSVIAYIVASCLYATHYALSSGTTDTMIYDTLLQEQGERKGFEKYFGHSTFLLSTGLIIGSLCGGLIAYSFGLRAAYLWTLPSATLAIISLLYFREPTLHKQEVQPNLWQHVRQTLQIVFQKGYVAWLLLSIVCFSLLSNFILQLGQLWALSLHLNLRLYGPLDALLLFGLALGGPLAAYAVTRKPIMSLLYGLSFVAVCLLLVENLPLVVLGQLGAVLLSTAICTMMLGRFHDVLPSSLRSGSSSVSSTLTSLALIPLVFLFGKLIDHFGISNASYLLLPIVAIGVLGVIKMGTKLKPKAEF
jgi:MFS family permease